MVVLDPLEPGSDTPARSLAATSGASSRFCPGNVVLAEYGNTNCSYWAKIRKLYKDSSGVALVDVDWLRPQAGAPEGKLYALHDGHDETQHRNGITLSLQVRRPCTADLASGAPPGAKLELSRAHVLCEDQVPPAMTQSVETDVKAATTLAPTSEPIDLDAWLGSVPTPSREFKESGTAVEGQCSGEPLSCVAQSAEKDWAHVTSEIESVRAELDAAQARQWTPRGVGAFSEIVDHPTNMLSAGAVAELTELTPSVLEGAPNLEHLFMSQVLHDETEREHLEPIQSFRVEAPSAPVTCKSFSADTGDPWVDRHPDRGYLESVQSFRLEAPSAPLAGRNLSDGSEDAWAEYVEVPSSSVVASQQLLSCGHVVSAGAVAELKEVMPSVLEGEPNVEQFMSQVVHDETERGHLESIQSFRFDAPSGPITSRSFSADTEDPWVDRRPDRGYLESVQSFRLEAPSSPLAGRSLNVGSEDAWAEYVEIPSSSVVASQRLLSCGHVVSLPHSSTRSDTESVYDTLHAQRAQILDGTKQPTQAALTTPQTHAVETELQDPQFLPATSQAIGRGTEAAQATQSIEVGIPPLVFHYQSPLHAPEVGRDDQTTSTAPLPTAVVISNEAGLIKPQRREVNCTEAEPEVAEEEMDRLFSAPKDTILRPYSEEYSRDPRPTTSSAPALAPVFENQPFNGEMPVTRPPQHRLDQSMSSPGEVVLGDRDEAARRGEVDGVKKTETPPQSAGAKVAQQAYSWWQNAVALPFAQFSQDVAEGYNNLSENLAAGYTEFSEDVSTRYNDLVGTIHSGDEDDDGNCDYDVNEPKEVGSVATRRPAEEPCAPLGSLPPTHEAYRWLHYAVALPALRFSKDVATGHQRFKEANDLHILVHKRASPEALYHMACCLSIGAERCIASHGRDTVPGLPPAGKRVPAELAEMRVDLALGTLTQAINSGYAEASSIFTDPDLKTVCERRPAEVSALAKRAQANSSLQASLPKGSVFGKAAPSLQASAAAQARMMPVALNPQCPRISSNSSQGSLPPRINIHGSYNGVAIQQQLVPIAQFAGMQQLPGA